MVAASDLTPAHITLGVNDIDESQRFYRDVLGFDVRRSGDRLSVSFGDFSLVLESAPPAARAKFSIGFRVSSAAALDELAERVRASKSHVLAGPAEGDGGGRVLLLMDPDHYQLEIIAP